MTSDQRTLTEQSIRAAIAALPPQNLSGQSVRVADLVEAVVVSPPVEQAERAAGSAAPGISVPRASVIVTLQAGARDPASLEPLGGLLTRTLGGLPGCAGAKVIVTGARPPAATAAAGAARPIPHAQPAGNKSPGASRPIAPDVRQIIAVASGKGGVGKSTTAVNLALALSASGASVGILDADIHGPSLPRLLNLKGKPDSRDGQSIEPHQAYGLKAMSIGLMLDEERPVIWRGPMVQSALIQLLRDVNWGILDYLVLDLPPGTGDIPLTLSQQAKLAGAVIVSTPQDLALIDARKGLAMFRKVGVPVLGIVENMSVYCCPNCGHEAPIFGHGGARLDAERLGVPFLGEVPLVLAIREGSDAGRPIVATDPASAVARAYLGIAARVVASLAALDGQAA